MGSCACAVVGPLQTVPASRGAQTVSWLLGT